MTTMDTATRNRIADFVGTQLAAYDKTIKELETPVPTPADIRAKTALDAEAHLQARRLIMWCDEQLDKVFPGDNDEAPAVTVTQFRHAMEERLCEILLDSSHDQVGVFDLAVRVRFNRLASRFFRALFLEIDRADTPVEG